MKTKKRHVQSPADIKETSLFREFISDQKFQAIILLVLLITFYLSAHFFITRSLISAPAPLFGGDYYFQLGQINHIKYGGSILDGSNINGSLPAYFISYGVIPGLIARLFSIPAFTAEIIFSYLVIALSICVVFWLAYKLFSNVAYASICVLIFVGSAPVIKYTEFGRILVMPLFFLAAYYFIEKKLWIHAVLLGAAYGLAGITHGVTFITASLFLLAIFIYYELVQGKLFKKIYLREYKEALKTVSLYAIILVIGISIAMLYWYKPIFIYHGKTSFSYMVWSQADVSTFKAQTAFFWSFMTRLVNSSRIILSALFILGIAGIFLAKNKTKAHKFIIFSFIVSFIIVFHYFITQALFNTNFAPAYMSDILFRFPLALFTVYGLHIGFSLLKQILVNKTTQEYLQYIIIFSLFVFLSYTVLQDSINYTKGMYFTVGQSPIPPNFAAAEQYIVNNTDVYDTFISSNELSFGLNAVTGRKALVSRRAHNDPFLDLDERNMAAAIILYGNNTALKEQLIEKYDIKYLFWDLSWISTEYSFDQNGNLVNFADPLLVFYSPENEQKLIDNGIKYFRRVDYVDPAMKGPQYVPFDLLYVSIENYRNVFTPWNANLDPYLESVWNYELQGMNYTTIYKMVRKNE